MFLWLHKLTSKYGKRSPNVLYTLYKARRISEASFFYSFIAVFPFSFVSNATNVFIYSISRFVLKKICSRVAGFLQFVALFVTYICKYTF